MRQHNCGASASELQVNTSAMNEILKGHNNLKAILMSPAGKTMDQDYSFLTVVIYESKASGKMRIPELFAIR
jgi:hypothetical protein